MKILIEYHKYNTLIEGDEVTYKDLKKMFNHAIKLRNDKYDEFADLFCQLNNFKIIKRINDKIVREDYKYIFDIDADLLLRIER